ncbi:uncharacterized protein LOC110746091 [Prunus avium]|uniref:Uncharacterized protein LOC110746091 n=1 Tax=Prunus avium TaxID=42229 RepID=A0A6P5RM31_PRUAV|nr:uncharacterized protein LOC110746091 [Prunus avium]
MGKKVLKEIWGKSDLACAVCSLQKQLINGMSCRYMWNQNRVKQTEQRIVKRRLSTGICAFTSLPVETCCVVQLPIFGMTQCLAVVGVARFYWSYAHIKLVIARYLSTTHSTCNV